MQAKSIINYSSIILELRINKKKVGSESSLPNLSIYENSNSIMVYKNGQCFKKSTKNCFN
jgi:hypothetical protein